MKTYFKEHLQTAASADNATNSKYVTSRRNLRCK